MNERRRQILKLMSLSPAAGGIAGCLQPPDEEIVPYVHMPEGAPPGESVYYASAFPVNGYAQGILIETHQGRPIKVEGNPNHPVARGASGIHSQAALFELYDPDRRRSPLFKDQPRGPDDLVTAILDRWPRYDQGHPVTIVTGPTTSPSLIDLIGRLRERWPQVDWRVHQPIDRRSVYRAGEIAFGRRLEPEYRLANASVIALFDADPCGVEPGAIAHARHLASRRRLDRPDAFSRIYAVESVPTPTGFKADERVAASPPEVEQALRSLAARLEGRAEAVSPQIDAIIDALVNDLRDAPAESLILAGPTLSPEIQALAMTLNHRLGNQGQTVVYRPAFAADADQPDLDPLPDAAGDVYVIDCDPVATSGVDVGAWLSGAEFSLRLSVYGGATDAHVSWRMPLLHPLESWSDGRAHDGTASVIQPGIAPLHGGWSAGELVGLLGDGRRASAYERVRAYWQRAGDEWHEALAKGVIEGAPPVVDPSPRDVALPQRADASPPILALRPDPSLLDGRHTPNDWLQELPNPVTTQVWGNAAWLSPVTAEALDLRSGQRVKLTTANGETEATALIVAGMADNTIALTLGHGERGGDSAYPLRGGDLTWWGPVDLAGADGREEIIAVQHHFELAGRNPVERGTLPELIASAEAEAEPRARHSLYGPIEYDGDYAWGMMIDLNACIGCSVCTIACQAENNIPAVGREEAARGRVMHWIRVDRYEIEDDRSAFQPVPCMHCEKAPCEYVCPVGATVHDSEGLNVMVYNRCIGTRDCSQNCPYKVRRFNWLDYNHYDDPEVARAGAPLKNPEVTVRERGVMEKCTYCLQRISRARIEAKREGRRIGEGEVTTACQQACPAQAITFGDLGDPESAVSRLAASGHAYSMLDELDTRPRTRYLPLVRNPRRGGEDG